MCFGEYSDYVVYVDLVNNCLIINLCDMLVVKIFEVGVNIDDVELVIEFYKCFDLVVMSIGVLLLEVYEVFVIVMNCLGGCLNLGEGGEDKFCYGIEKNLCIK